MNLLRSPVLNEEQARSLLGHAMREIIRPAIVGGKRVWITISEETRTLPQNAKFHAACTDISKSHLEWAGKRRTAAQWKTLLVSGHAVATKEEVEFIPGLEGEFVNVRESTALMSVSRGASLISYTEAFAATNGVKLNDPNDWMRWGIDGRV